MDTWGELQTKMRMVNNTKTEERKLQELEAIKDGRGY